MRSSGWANARLHPLRYFLGSGERYFMATHRTMDDLAKMQAFYDAGNTVRSLDVEFGRGSHRWAMRHGIKTRSIEQVQAVRSRPPKTFHYICDECGMPFTTTFSRREERKFCNQSCAAKFQMRSPANRKHLSEIFTKRHFIQSGNDRLYEHDCAGCGIHFLWPYKKKKYCAECLEKSKRSPERAAKVSIAARKRVAEGRHHGWVVPRNQPSYAEKFFMRVLANNGIRYSFELKAGLYYIDFAITHKRIALEIDGQQHRTNPAQHESDVRKDVFLKEQQWTVYRIPWQNINRPSGSASIKASISCFVEFYNSTPIHPSRQICFKN